MIMVVHIRSLLSKMGNMIRGNELGTPELTTALLEQQCETVNESPLSFESFCGKR